jgi:hypothetical protein
MNDVSREMPKYKCHKEVHALKIKEIEFLATPNADATITPAEEGYAPFSVSAEWVNKHNPEVGGYYVVYDDGYSSWSPAKAFEDGYTRV